MGDIPWLGGYHKSHHGKVGAISPAIVVQWLHKLSKCAMVAYFFIVYIYMTRYYTHSIPAYLIHLSHLSSGIWLSYIGYKNLIKEDIEEYHYSLLSFVGIILTIYFIYLTIKHIPNDFSYSLGINKYIILLLHIVHGILFILIGMKYIDMNDILSLYLLIIGSASALYHTHLMISIDTTEKGKCINECLKK